MAEVLTKARIDTEIAKFGKGKRVELRDDREPGLWMRIGERGAQWCVQVRTRGGPKTRVNLGRWPALGISDAREAAREAKKEAALGVNPNEARRDEARAAEAARLARRTLADVLDQYEREKLAMLKPGRGAATRRALDGKKGLLRDLAGLEPRSINRDHIRKAVDRAKVGKGIGANRNLAYARAFFNWCVVEGIVDTNPAGTVRKPAKENSRDRYHSVSELQEIWAATDGLGYPFRHLYRLLIVLPMRREEIAALPVAELDLGPDSDPAQGVWTIPGERTKTNKPLRVPLSSLARSIILEALADPDRPIEGTDAAGITRPNPYLFSTTGYSPVSGFAKGKRRLDKAISDARVNAAREAAEAAGTQYDGAPEEMAHWTVHDLRTTFSTLACDRLNVDLAVADRCLNHAASASMSKIAKVYNKSELFEPRKLALCAWASLIETDVLGTAPTNVTPLRQGEAA